MDPLVEFLESLDAEFMRQMEATANVDLIRGIADDLETEAKSRDTRLATLLHQRAADLRAIVPQHRKR